MSEDKSPTLVAGKHLPWQDIAMYFLRLEKFFPLASIDGHKVGKPTLGAYGFAVVELPNPDVTPAQRLVTLPTEHASDYKSLYSANLDRNVKDKLLELVIVYEHRRGMLGGVRSGLHIAGYPVGTWGRFFDAVGRHASQDFTWPKAVFLFQPSSTTLFQADTNSFQP